MSEKYLNPINKPDEWEMRGLKAFEKGIREVSEVTDINGMPYMRLFKPIITIKECLKCHGHQGYKVEDIRGSISVAIPMKPYYESMSRELKDTTVTYLFLWAAGAVIILFFNRNIQKEQQKT